MKRALIMHVMFLIFCVTSLDLQAQDLYFCKEYKDDREVGKSSLFTLPASV